MMTEHTAHAAAATGAGLVTLLTAAFGPVLGEYMTIVWASLAGALWPLSAMKGEGKIEGAKFLFRVVLTATTLTSVLAYLVNQHWNVPVPMTVAPVAFVIGVAGNRWMAFVEWGIGWLKGKFPGGNKEDPPK
jgi:hypothetical protein